MGLFSKLAFAREYQRVNEQEINRILFRNYFQCDKVTILPFYCIQSRPCNKNETTVLMR